MKKIILAATAAAMLSTAASAEITWTHNSGGFVGKGDVQVPLGLNNAQLQSGAASLAFSYTEARSYDVACFKEEEVMETTGTGRNMVRTRVIRRTDREFTRPAPVSATVAFEARQGRSQITGFNLSPISIAPIVGTCPGGWNLDSSEGDPVSNVVRESGTLSANGIVLPTYIPTYN
jgi:hypothetical protein